MACSSICLTLSKEILNFFASSLRVTFSSVNHLSFNTSLLLLSSLSIAPLNSSILLSSQFSCSVSTEGSLFGAGKKPAGLTKALSSSSGRSNNTSLAVSYTHLTLPTILLV